MNFSSEAIKILDALCEKFGIIIDWSQENILPYAEQLYARLINYEIATSIFHIVTALLFCALFVFCGAKLYKKSRIDTREPEMYFAFSFGVMAVAILIFALFCLPEFKDIITALTFPDMVVFNFIKPLL